MTQPTLWQPSDIVSAEAGGEAETPKRRGRIPQSAWPHILERHRAGATLSAIAREFDCTPSAISYIVRKAEAAGIVPSEEGGPPPESAPDAEGAPEAQGTLPEPPPEPPAEAPAAPVPEEAAPAEEAVRPAEAEPAPAAPPAAPTARLREPGRREGRREPRQGGLLRAAPKREDDAARATAPRATETQRDAPPAQQPAAPQPAPAASAAAPSANRSEPVDAVEGRLRDTARSCLVAYRGWRTQPGEQSIQALSDALHDLRKALARIEIDISASRRDEQAQRPIPIPAHRASRRPR